MRYTTLIDIRDIPEVYRNQNVRLLYLQLVLMAGYHDADRDIVRCSLRSLADQTGLTLSATRHAIDVLIKWRLLRHQKSYFRVRKYIEEQEITPRAKTTKQAAQKASRDAERSRQQNLDQTQQKDREEVAEIFDQGKTPFMLYYEDQERKAAHGDQDAARIVQVKRLQYLEHQKAIKNQTK